MSALFYRAVIYKPEHLLYAKALQVSASTGSICKCPSDEPSTTAKEKLAQVQQQMGSPVLKLINEVPTRWNSTYHMLARMSEQKDAVWVSLAALKTDVIPLTIEEFQIIEETVKVLAPFNQATEAKSLPAMIFNVQQRSLMSNTPTQCQHS
ncbi:hypothetical protein WMY93_012050 [Mugilogobius chulae]|uniref:Uncharacterized protein n=1 Tax=Mugilogobius chulae TaxID=88201 RepID=A0AAW0PEL0_9GOBI